MPTQLKSDTARANGAKSHGPKTAEGRAKSSRNAVKHGLSSRNPLVLECENEDDFQAVHDHQMEIHQPATPAEKDLVDQMVAARWRILRLLSIETDLRDTEMRRKQEIERERDRHNIVRLSDTYSSEANHSRAMALASRCESRFNRMYQSSYKILRELQAVRPKQSNEPAAPEPTQPEPAIGEPAEKKSYNEPKSPVVLAGGAGDSPAKNLESDVLRPQTRPTHPKPEIRNPTSLLATLPPIR